MFVRTYWNLRNRRKEQWRVTNGLEDKDFADNVSLGCAKVSDYYIGRLKKY